MGYSIHLNKPGEDEPIQIDHLHSIKGSIYQLGGSDRLETTITYNYSKYYYDYMGEAGIRELYGKTGKETIPLLESTIEKLIPIAEQEKLNNIISESYWSSTAENAIKALQNLIRLAELGPEGIWVGD